LSVTAEGHGVLLTVAYDGRGLAGFAKQKTARTVAGELEGALREIDPRISDLRGASRTDAGVHARGQRVAFDPDAVRPLAAWVLGAARHLPDAIAVRRASRVARGFVPRFAARSKHYRYVLLADGVRDPFWDGRSWRIPELREDASLCRAAEEARAAMGTHDFAAFKTASDPRTMTVRTLTELAVTRDPNDARVVRVDVRGNAFMHNMVRILVGTIVDVARGRLEPGAIARALASKQRSDGGITAPADGLYLESIDLDVEELEVFEP
jgi:tRNA pseudouridine38-40 synthase